jgi:arsenate reductase
MTRILILCTGNSCRSQMAEYILKSLDTTLDVHSAGTNPASRVHPNAITVMEELGISLSGAFPKNVERFINESFDYVITVCDNARETCPVFVGKVQHRLHMGLEDPAEAVGTEDEVMTAFRRVRDEIKSRFQNFYSTEVLAAKPRGILRQG